MLVQLGLAWQERNLSTSLSQQQPGIAFGSTTLRPRLRAAALPLDQVHRGQVSTSSQQQQQHQQ